MRNAISFTFVLCIVCFYTATGQTKSTISQSNSQVENVNPDTVRIGQMDGTLITLAGVGTAPLEYTETTDGYTIVTNQIGVYEYAEQTKNGGLQPSGVKANNPNKRDKKEIKYLEKKVKHLRYQGDALEKIQNRYKRLNTTPKKEKKK